MDTGNDRTADRRDAGRGVVYRTLVTWLGLCGLVTAVTGCRISAAAAAQDDEAAILAIYETMRAAHFERDPAKFLTAVDDGYWVINSGQVVYRQRAAALAGLRDYFAHTRFDSVEDIVPPRVTIGPGGETAWLIGEVKVRARQRGADGFGHRIAFRSAWLDIYRKRDGRWWLEVHANTQRDLPE
jgi:uncharacterized protein (TIGR02246 family)